MRKPIAHRASSVILGKPKVTVGRLIAGIDPMNQPAGGVK
jgi:hypothetical protein